MQADRVVAGLGRGMQWVGVAAAIWRWPVPGVLHVCVRFAKRDGLVRGVLLGLVGEVVLLVGVRAPGVGRED
jgi:hypothetical protein